MKYIILLSFLCFIPVSQAEIHIEPYVNAGGAYSSSIPSSPNSLFMVFSLGGRFGYNFTPISVGFDLFWTHYAPSSGIHHMRSGSSEASRPGFDTGPGSTFEHSKTREVFQPFSLGVFTSVDLPFLFNAYGTIFYSIPAESINVNYQGYGARAGLSYLSAFYVQLNVELQWAYYTCTESVNCSDDFNIFSALLSVSVPFSTDIFDFGDSSDSENPDTEESEASSNSDI